MAREFDLFGHPLPSNLGEPGRNEHVPTPENSNKIRLLLIAGWTRQAIAEEIGVSVPTLRKHYFRDLKKAREIAIAQAKGKVLLQLDDEAAKGNVSAMKELRKVIEREELDRLPEKPKAAKSEQPGKKEQKRRAAQRPIGGWQGRLPGSDLVQ